MSCLVSLACLPLARPLFLLFVFSIVVLVSASAVSSVAPSITTTASGLLSPSLSLARLVPLPATPSLLALSQLHDRRQILGRLLVLLQIQPAALLQAVSVGVLPGRCVLS